MPDLKVFVSWSGTQSKNVAKALKVWVPKMLAQKVVLFVSDVDIDKGERGLTKIADSLEESSFGIVVVTPENQDSPWINFEAGALGKSVDQARLAPLLVGLGDVDVKGPIKQFQNTEAADDAAVRSLVHSINKTLNDSVAVDAVDVLFDKYWPDLERDIAKSLPDPAESKPDSRSDSDLLVEILTTVRSLRRDVEQLQRDSAEPVIDTVAEFGDRVIGELVSALNLVNVHCITKADGIEIKLEEGAPSVTTSVQLRLRKLARLSGFSAKISRPNGSWLLVDPHGRDTRKVAD